ncbi:MAG: ISNCY family transposase, partial [Anaerolineae bacterium]|nr:ISNCY family transposase [Anaerolineae bacterium]
MGDKVTLSQRRLRQWHLLKMVLERRMTLREASERMEVSYRHAKRLKHVVARDGPRGLIHGNTGKRPANALALELRQKIVALSRTEYALFNDTHFTEKLFSVEGIRIGRETARRIRREAGIPPKRRRRPGRHRSRRVRRPQEGMMVLWDGSVHRWFGEGHAPCCLVAAIDDATSRCLAARFFPFESSEAYLWLLRQMLTDYGIPLSIYQDRHSCLKRNDTHWTLEEQLRGRQDPTQVGWALEELSIQPIYALSAQAKGRIERFFGTFQDRLIAELKRAGITDITEANLFLEGFLEAHNRQFGRASEKPHKAWRPLAWGLDIDRVCSFRYEATVGNDNTVRLGGITIDIPPGPCRASYAKARVQV